MTTTMTTTTEDLFEEDTPVAELIATKLWWGWTPRWSSGIWSKPGERYPGSKTTEKMTKEEQEWFKSH